VASGIEFRNHVRNGPKDVTNVGTAPTEHLTIEGLSGGDNGEKRISGLWNGSAVFLQRLHGDFVGFLMQDVFERESKHIHGGPIGELQLGLRIEGDQADVEVADESAETLFAFPESVEGLALLGEIGDGNDNAGDFACGVKFRDGVQKGPSNARRGAAAHADNLAANRLFGGQDDGNGTGLGRQLGAVLAKSEETEIIGGFAEELFILAAKRVLDGLIGKEDANLGVVDDDCHVEIFDERAETLFAGAEEFLRGLAFGDVADGDEAAPPAVEIKQSAGHLPDADEAGFGAITKLAFPKFAGLHELQENLSAAAGIFPEIHLAGSFAKSVFASVAGETCKAIVDVEVRAVGEDVDGHGIWAGTKSGREHALGTAQSFLGFEQVVGNHKLFAVGEVEAYGGAQNGGGHGEPSEGKLFA